MASEITIEEMATFCKRKGFVYKSSEIYGGASGFYDYGPFGVDMKNSIKQLWWGCFVVQREDMAGIDGSIITNPKVWIASGHAQHFTDIILECKKCKHKARGDHLVEDVLKISTEGLKTSDIDRIIAENNVRCQKCGGELGQASNFNLMFRTFIGPVHDENSAAYLRPETAQTIFADFKLVQENARKKLPFGIAQIGKAFRNEISPRDFLFRSREFEQMEIEFFVHPEKVNQCAYFDEIAQREVNVLSALHQEKNASHSLMKFEDMAKQKIATKWHLYWLAKVVEWFVSLGIRQEHLRLREHKKDELAHYAGACFDVEYKFPFGWKEIHGCADRKQFDLMQHQNMSGEDMSIFDEETKSKVVPYVAAEPSQGVDRAYLAFMFEAYNDDKERGNIVLKFHPKLAPIKVGVFPLVNKEPILERARAIFDELKASFNTVYDKSGSVGRRYARMDELGTPLCVTVDFQSVEDGTVTIRNRDTTEQIRVSAKELKQKIFAFIDGERFESLGEKVAV